MYRIQAYDNDGRWSFSFIGNRKEIMESQDLAKELYPHGYYYVWAI